MAIYEGSKGKGRPKSLQKRNHGSTATDLGGNSAKNLAKRTDNNEKDKNRCLICNQISLFLRLVSRSFVDSICVLLLL